MNGPKLVAIETTRRCNLHCVHCRASAGISNNRDSRTGQSRTAGQSLPGRASAGKALPSSPLAPVIGGEGQGEGSSAPAGELTKEEIFGLFDALAERGRPIVILTGGEPLMREDIFEIARRGADMGFHMSMAPNGTLMDEAVARRMVASGIQRISISLDAATAEAHDAFRQMPGAFAGAMKGIDAARKAGLSFQINTSVTAFNAAEVPKVHELAKSLGAAGHHIFMLVRVGRGRALDAELSAPEQEKMLHWLGDRAKEGLIAVRATCAPHYFRILEQGRNTGPHAGGPLQVSITRGCTAGDRFVFISSTGHVQPCGYLEIDCGDLRRQTFWDIWDNHPVLNDLRHWERLKGKCGLCEFRSVCGGCRARAYAATGDPLAEEPACLYQPKTGTKG